MQEDILIKKIKCDNYDQFYLELSILVRKHCNSYEMISSKPKTNICKYCDTENEEMDELCYKCPTEDLLSKIMELSKHYWDIENNGHAVIWAKDNETGQFFAYTRGEYSDNLIKCIENLKTFA